MHTKNLIGESNAFGFERVNRRRKTKHLFASGCLIAVSLGLFLLRLYQTSGETDQVLKPLGLSLIFVAVLTLAIAANLTDKICEQG